MSFTPDPVDNDAAPAARHPLKRPGASLTRIARLVWQIWPDRHRQRACLREMEPHRLDDIGISHVEARRESRKPFWR